jgi:fibronectin-binding autotransporter adhesin
MNVRQTHTKRQLPGVVTALLALTSQATDYQWNGTTGDWQTASNWSSTTTPPYDNLGVVPPFNTSGAHRLNVNGATALIYSVAEGTTVFANTSGRGLVVGSPSSSGAMTITGGTFSTLGSTSADVIANAASTTSTVTIAGGTLIGNASGLVLGLGGTGVVNLNSGTLSMFSISKGAGGNANFNFNGGTLQARQTTATFMTGLTSATVNSGGAFIDSNGFNITIGQALLAGSPSGGLTKSGTGILTLTGANTYTGGTTISDGTLQIGNGGSTGSIASAATINSGGTLEFYRNNDTTITTTFAGAGDLRFSGTGTSQQGHFDPQGNSSSFTGAVTVNLARLQLNSVNDVGSASSITVNNLGQIWVTGGANIARPLTMTGIGWLESAGNLGAIRIDGASTYSGAITLAGDARIHTHGGGDTGTISGAISDGAGSYVLEKSGSGILYVSNSGNTHDGGTKVSGGYLRITDDGALGSASAPLTLQTGGRIMGGTLAAGANVTLNGSRPISLASGDGYFHVWTGFTMNASGPISGSGNLVKSDGGTLNFSGTGSVGNTRIETGTLQLSGGALNAGANLSMNGTSTLAITGGTHSATRLVTSDNSGVLSTINHSAGTFNVTGSVNSGTSSSFLLNHWGASGAASTYNLSGGVLNAPNAPLNLGWDGTARLIQTGGTANLQGINFNNGKNNAATYQLTAGRLNIGTYGMNGGASAKWLQLNGGTLGAYANWSSGQQINVSATSTIDTLDSVDGVTGRTISLSGVMSGTGGVIKAGDGTLALTANSTYTGGTTVNGGTLSLGTGGSTGVIRGTLTVNSGASVTYAGNNSFGYTSGQSVNVLNIVGGTVGDASRGNHFWNSFALNMTGGTLNLGWDAGQTNNEFHSPTITVNSSASQAQILAAHASATLRLRDNTSGTFNVADGAQAVDLLVTAPIVASGTNHLTKTGTGAMRLAGANTYTGTTTVSGGTLMVTGTGRLYTGGHSTSVVTVQSGGVLELDTWSYSGATQSLGMLAAGAGQIVLNNGTIRMNGTTTYGRGVTVNSGGATLEAASGANWTIDTVNDNTNWVYNSNPSLTFTGAGTGTFQKVFSAGGGLTKSGTGTWNFSGANTYTGATTISAGTMAITGGGTLGNGSYAAGITNNGVLHVNSTANQTFSGVVSGSGALVKSSTGTLILSANNTFSGGTTISAGTLQVGNGGTTGSLGSGNILNNGTLIYSYSNAAAVGLPFSPGLSGTGTLSATARDLAINGNMNQGGITLTQTGGGGLYQGIELAAAAPTLTASSISLTGDVGKRSSDGYSLALDTSAANGPINLNISLGRSGVWYIPTGFTANAGTGAINVTGTGPASSGWRNTPVTLTGAINITGAVNSAVSVTLNAAGTSSASGVLSGAMSLTKGGASTLTLTGDNTYSGATTINTGTLEIGSAGRLGAGSYAGNITNNATLLFNSTANQTLSGNMTGNGTLVKNNTGILTLSTPKSYTGLTTVNGGTLTVNGTGTLSGTTGLSVASGATFNYMPSTLGTMTMNAGSTLSFATGSILGLNWDATTSSRIAALGAATMGSGVKVSMTGAYTSGTTYTILTAGSGLTSGSYTAINNVDYTAVFGQSATAVTMTPTTVTPLSAAYWKGGTTGYEAVLGVASNWTTDGAGTVSGLTPGAAANVYFSDSGAAAGNQVNMTMGANMALNSITVNGTTGSPVNTNPVSLSSTGGYTLTLTGSGGTGITMNTGAGALTLNAAIALGNSQTWTNNSSNALTVNGVVSSGNALTKAGTGDVILSAANTYSGGTTVNAGTLTSYGGSAAGAKAMFGTGAVTVNSGATVRFLADSTGNSMTYANNFTLNSASLISQDANVTVNGTVDLTGANAMNVVYGDKSATLAGVVGGTGSITKTGPGTLTLSNNGNTFSGGVTVSAGTFAVSAGTGAGAKSLFGTGAVTVNSGATVRVGAGSTSNAMSYANDFNLNGGTLHAQDAVVTYNGTITLGATSTVYVQWSGKNAIFANPVGGAGGLTKTGSGDLILAANNTYAGSTSVSGGSGNLVVGNGGTTGSLGTHTGPVSVASGSRLIFNRSDSVALANEVTGAGGLANYGTGTLTLTGANTLTSWVTVRQGAITLPTGGSLNGVNLVRVGENGGAGTPVFNLNGGTIVASGTGNAILIGGDSGFSGQMNVTAGSFSTSTPAATITVGDNATGTYIQTGGTVSAGSSSGALWVANNPGGTGSVFSISGGTFNAPGTSVLGVRGSYTFTTSGTAQVNMGTLQLGHTLGTTNNPTGRIINLNGGTLTLTGGINYQNSNTNGTTVNLNGGTLRAASSTATFWNHNANVAAVVGASGGTIDTQGYDITVSQVLGGSGALAKSGAGVLTLSGANTYSGPLTVNAGHLNVTGSLGALSSLNVTPSTQFSYSPATPATLNMAASAPVTLGNNSTVGLSWNATTSSRIATSGAATVGSNVGFEMFGTPTAIEYTLLTAASGLNNTYTVRNNSNYVVGSWNIDPSGTFVKMTPTPVAALTAAYWTGGLSGSANVWAASDGMTASNWAATDGAAVQVLVPGSGADVIVSNSALSTVPSSTTLGANMTIKSLTISDTTNGLGLNADGYKLTITPLVSTAGINMTGGVPASTIDANVGLGANQTWTNNSTGLLNVTGVISGSGTLAKAGTGTVRVTSPDNSFNSALTLSAGTFEVGGAGRLNLGSYSGAIASTGVLLFNSSANQTLSGVMSGTGGALVKSGSGILTLTNVNTYTGGTVVNGGTLVLSGNASGNTRIAGAVTVNSGATLEVGGDGTGLGYNNQITSLVINGGLVTSSPASHIWNITGGITMTGGTLQSNNGVFTTTGSQLEWNRTSVTSLASSDTATIAGRIRIRGDNAYTAIPFTVADGAAAVDFQITAAITENSGGLGITKNGLGTLLLNSTGNSYTGATTINDGLLVVAGGNGIGDGSSVVLSAVNAGAGLRLDAGEIINSLAGGSATAGAVNLQGNTLQIGQQSGNATTTYDGVISGAGGLVRRGAGTTTLTGDNTFTGSLKVQDTGTVAVPSITAMGVNQPLGAGATPILLQGGTLAITGAGTYTTNRGLQLVSPSNESGTLSVAGTVNMTADITGGSTGSTFTKAGTGTFNFSGTGSWSGNLNITGGVFELSGAGSIPTSGVTTLSGGASLKINTSGVLQTTRITAAAGTTVSLEAGTLRVAGGDLGGSPVYSIDNTGSFTWGTGTTISVFGGKTSGQTDRTSLAGAASGPAIKEGNYLFVKNDLTQPAGSTLDLGGLYGSSDSLRYNQIHVTGLLTIDDGASLKLDLNPYYLRPFGANERFTGDWGTLVLAYAAGGISGDYDFANVLGITSDRIGWTRLADQTDSYFDPASLALDTYLIEYRTGSGSGFNFVQAGGAILLHYKVSGSVPEPASAGLLVAGALLLRALRRRKA